MRRLRSSRQNWGIRKPILSVKLMQSLSEKEGTMTDDKNDLEMIATCGATEAPMIEELLKNNGIECTLQGNVTANVLPLENDFDEVRIWVKRENAVAAQELVDAFFTPVAKDELTEGREDLGVEDPDEPGGFTV